MRNKILPNLYTLILPLALILPQSIWAGDIDQLGSLAQGQFRSFSEDLGSGLSYKAVAPAEPQGLTGFDIGIELTATELENPALWDTASSGGDLSTLVLPKVHVHKGLPFDIDVGAFYASASGSNVSLIGGEVRYAILDGGMATPAVAIRGTFSSLDGVDDLDLDTTGVELAISKGFLNITPFASIGSVRVESTPNVGGLTTEKFSLDKWSAGVNINLGLTNLAFEYDETGDATSASLKVGFRF